MDEETRVFSFQEVTASREWLEQAYVIDKRSFDDIAIELNTTVKALFLKLQEYGLL